MTDYSKPTGTMHANRVKNETAITITGQYGDLDNWDDVFLTDILNNNEIIYGNINDVFDYTSEGNFWHALRLIKYIEIDSDSLIPALTATQLIEIMGENYGNSSEIFLRFCRSRGGVMTFEYNTDYVNIDNTISSILKYGATNLNVDTLRGFLYADKWWREII
jgi:hypothetical protein